MCDVTRGQWWVIWYLSVQTGRATATGAHDHLNNVPLDLHDEWLPESSAGAQFASGYLPGIATETGLTITLTLDGRTTNQVRMMPLPGGCAVAAVTDCAGAPKPTYTHTFDAITGTAAVMVANGRYCRDEYLPFSFVPYYAVTPDWYSRYGGYYGYGITGGSGLFSHGRVGSKLAFHADLPPCSHQLALVMDEVWTDPITTGPTPYQSRIVGGPDAPGNNSVGPYGRHVGVGETCVDLTVASVQSLCDGTMRAYLTNGSAAVLSIPVTYWLLGQNFGWPIGGIDPGNGNITPLDLPRAGATGIRIQAGLDVTISTHTWRRPAVCAPVTPKPPLVRRGSVPRRFL